MECLKCAGVERSAFGIRRSGRFRFRSCLLFIFHFSFRCRQIKNQKSKICNQKSAIIECLECLKFGVLGVKTTSFIHYPVISATATHTSFRGRNDRDPPERTVRYGRESPKMNDRTLFCLKGRLMLGSSPPVPNGTFGQASVVPPSE